MKQHGLRKHKLYATWLNMRQRCNNPNNKRFKDYGGRGISVCYEWNDVRNFINDMYPTYQDGLTLDRIDNNKGYSKENCRWTTYSIQAMNTRRKNTNKTGYKGVSFKGNNYIARVGINTKIINLGTYNTSFEAAIVRDRYIIDNKLEHTLNFEREDL